MAGIVVVVLVVGGTSLTKQAGGEEGEMSMEYLRLRLNPC